MILVTGGTGLVGSHLILSLLKKEKRVRAIYRNPDTLDQVRKVFLYYTTLAQAEAYFKKIEWVEAGLTDIPALKKAFDGVDEVYHCAALVSFDSRKDHLLRKTNVEGTANIVNLCISRKISKLCHLSSIATLDPAPADEIITEQSFWNKEKNHGMYAISKYGAEMEVWRASQEGVPVVILNPGIIIGPGFWGRGSGRIFRKAATGANWYLSKVSGFIGVDDVVQLMQELMDHPVKNEQFIAVAQNLSFEVVQKTAAQSFGHPGPKYKLKPWMVKLAWIWENLWSLISGNERLLTQDSHKNLFDNKRYSSEKIQALLRYNFEPVKAVVEATAALYKQERRD